MILATVQYIEGKRIAEYLGIVTGTDMYAMTVPTKKCNEMLRISMEKVTHQLVLSAEAVGADAVIGVTFSVMENMWLVATGTAVKLESKERGSV